MFKSLQKETKNNIVFILLLSFLIFFSHFGNSIPLIFSFLSIFAGLLLFFGGFAYGLYSKNPLKSLLFGLSIPFLMIIFSIFSNGIEDAMRGFMYTFIILIISALSGFFAALSSTKTDKGVFYLFTALFCLLVEVLYIVSGIN
jgi:hypothetical protein